MANLGILGKTRRFLAEAGIVTHRSPLLVTLVATAVWALALLVIVRARYDGGIRDMPSRRTRSGFGLEIESRRL